ncbi:bifunctional (p)ppGpp synthetase/guanosine-3',5'-bis(diphosphate) 3'-pyrophosphohydrolase [bacterium]|nr:bifunctional (p)ppGpp synthetase/guanosine-3',5'-bis(diphosphate) 3'-pyrophosphohydrolase [bacterium]
MKEDIVRMAKAIDFAARAHAPQRRKGEAEEPYVNHLAEVALLVAEATQGADASLVIAAYLHDTIEDREVMHETLVAEFGQDVADLVREVTDDKSLKKEERKRLQIEHARSASPRAKHLKLADKISNLNSILSSPPAEWSAERKREYFDWAAQVVAGCRGVNSWLEARFDAACARRAELG